MAKASLASGRCDEVPDGSSAAGSRCKSGSVVQLMVMALGRASRSASADEGRIGWEFGTEMLLVFSEVPPKSKNRLRPKCDVERLVALSGPVQ
jgi:hypothetical protein